MLKEISLPASVKEAERLLELYQKKKISEAEYVKRIVQLLIFVTSNPPTIH